MSVNLSNIERASPAFDGTSASDYSFNPSITADGTTVVFDSFSANLIPNDFNGVHDIFLRDLTTGSTTRLSELPGSVESFFDAWNPQISGDGSTVVFETMEGGYVGNDFNGSTDVFAMELGTGNVVRATIKWDGTEIFSGAFNSSISNDGRYVAYQTFEDGITLNDFNGFEDVFVRDLFTGTNLDVSGLGLGGAPADGMAGNPEISGNGQFVVFESMATNLVASDFNFHMDIFVHDLATGITERITNAVGGGDPDNYSADSAISDDGQFVAFLSHANNLTANDGNGFIDAFLNDRQTGTTIRISDGTSGTGTDLMEISISPDGRFVTYGSMDPFNPSIGKTYIYDQQTGTTQELLGVDFATPTDFSADNSMMAFATEASIDPADTNGLLDIYAADTGIAPPPPPPISSGEFTSGDDTVDLNLVSFDPNDPMANTNALEGSDTVFLSNDSFNNLPFFGGDGNDMIIGSTNGDFISGDAGNDTLMGDDGDDGILGGDGLDLIFGGDGHDDLAGGADNDRLFGDNGMDDLAGGFGDDQLTGGADADTFHFSGDMTGADIVKDFTAGEDTLMLSQVLDFGGNLIASFADLDTDFSGNLDLGDANTSTNGTDLTLDLMGGSITFDNILNVAQADVMVA